MSSEDRIKWDARYGGVSAARSWSPSPLLNEALVEWRRRRGELRGLAALDVACGGGRNSLLLAAAGIEVDGLDISRQGLDLARRREQSLAAGVRRSRVRWLEADLEEPLPVSESYDLIVMIRYLDLDLLRRLLELLNPGGMLVVELHLAEGTRQATAGPRNPDYLVQPGALADCCGELEAWRVSEGRTVVDGGGQEALAQFVGFRGDSC